jgi:hypothetical protein
MEDNSGISNFTFTCSFVSSILGQVGSTTQNKGCEAYWDGSVLDLETGSSVQTQLCCLSWNSVTGDLNLVVNELMVDTKAMYSLIGYAEYHSNISWERSVW